MKDYVIRVQFAPAPNANTAELVPVCATDYQDAVSQSWFGIRTADHKRVVGHKADSIHACQHKKGVIV